MLIQELLKLTEGTNVKRYKISVDAETSMLMNTPSHFDLDDATTNHSFTGSGLDDLNKTCKHSIHAPLWKGTGLVDIEVTSVWFNVVQVIHDAQNTTDDEEEGSKIKTLGDAVNTMSSHAANMQYTVEIIATVEDKPMTEKRAAEIIGGVAGYIWGQYDGMEMDPDIKFKAV